MKLHRLVAITAVAALGVGVAGAAAGFAIRGSVVANGGSSAPPSSNGVYAVYGTAGQAAMGRGANSRECSGFWCFGGPRVLAVGPVALPVEFALGPTTPSPTHGEARFQLALPKAALVTLSVFDVAGRQVGGTVSHRFQAGQHELFWRASTERAGIYFMRVETDGVLRARRTIVLVR